MNLHKLMVSHQEQFLVNLISKYDSRYVELGSAQNLDQRLKCYEEEIRRLSKHGVTDAIRGLAEEYLEQRGLQTSISKRTKGVV